MLQSGFLLGICVEGNLLVATGKVQGAKISAACEGVQTHLCEAAGMHLAA